MDWSRHLCETLHCPTFLWALLYMCALHCSEGKTGWSFAGLLVVQSVHLAHSHQYPRHWKKLKCWTCDNWLSGSTVEVVTRLEHFHNLPQLN